MWPPAAAWHACADRLTSTRWLMPSRGVSTGQAATQQAWHGAASSSRPAPWLSPASPLPVSLFRDDFRGRAREQAGERPVVSCHQSRQGSAQRRLSRRGKEGRAGCSPAWESKHTLALTAAVFAPPPPLPAGRPAVLIRRRHPHGPGRPDGRCHCRLHAAVNGQAGWACQGPAPGTAEPPPERASGWERGRGLWSQGCLRFWWGRVMGGTHCLDVSNRGIWPPCCRPCPCEPAQGCACAAAAETQGVLCGGDGGGGGVPAGCCLAATCLAGRQRRLRRLGHSPVTTTRFVLPPGMPAAAARKPIATPLCYRLVAACCVPRLHAWVWAAGGGLRASLLLGPPHARCFPLAAPLFPLHTAGGIKSSGGRAPGRLLRQQRAVHCLTCALAALPTPCAKQVWCKPLFPLFYQSAWRPLTPIFFSSTAGDTRCRADRPACPWDWYIARIIGGITCACARRRAGHKVPIAFSAQEHADARQQ